MAEWFTPGPWRYEEPDVSDRGIFHEGCVLSDGNGTDAKPQVQIATIRIGLAGSMHNGHLIAAAPELYEALCEAVEQLQKNFIEVPQSWTAALAKARGETGIDLETVPRG